MVRYILIGLVILTLLGIGAYWHFERPQGCGITVSAPEGPEYVSGASAVTDGNLDYTNLPGSPLTVSGHVYEGLGDSKPVAGAVLDIWQPDSDGTYHPSGSGSASKYPGQLALRGTITTDAEGYYEFKTIYPGQYFGRTRHIHIKIRAPSFNELTTQLVFALKGDAIGFYEDVFSHGLPACMWLSAGDTEPPAMATFDFRLAK